MIRNASTSNRKMRNKFGSTSTCGSSQVPSDQQLQTYTDHYGGKWVGKKRYFVNILIYTYESLGSVRHIMVGKPTKLSTDTTATEFTVAEPPWSTLYEKRCELEVYCRWQGLRVTKARSAELLRDEPANILSHLEQENNQMQLRLDHFHAIQKVSKHLKGKAQERAMKFINEITALDDERDISDFSDSSNDDFQKFLPSNIRRCC
ncbi:hypothetical protein SO802_015076 [Lithocarpus litseifolius]|uniref:Uncharacterized protein n=1 Tax=Lithocarpus litseifolius TaxID=425828 RepID=A0AAW2CVY7_9ROSI